MEFAYVRRINRLSQAAVLSTAVTATDTTVMTMCGRCQAGFMGNDELAVELVERMDRDQEARSAHERGDQSDWSIVRAVDTENTAWLAAIIDERGWPLQTEVGGQAAGAAWLLAQHADENPDFQRRCLTLLTGAVDAGEADPAHLAFLTDRVRRADGRPQVYGTQFWPDPETPGRFVPQPIEDVATVDERRASVGLEPLATRAEIINNRYRTDR